MRQNMQKIYYYAILNLKVLFLDKKLVNNEFNEKFRQNLIELQLVCYFLNFHAPLRLHEIDQHATQLIHFDF